MQNYFSDSRYDKQTKITIFKWRIFMENFGLNYRAGRKDILCSLCLNHQDSEQLSFESSKIREKINIPRQFEDIFEDDINEETVHIIRKIMKIREQKT